MFAFYTVLSYTILIQTRKNSTIHLIAHVEDKFVPNILFDKLLTVVFDAIFPVLFSSLTYQRVCNQINTTSATGGAGDAYPFGAPKFIPDFQLGWCYSIFSLICIFCVDRCLSFCAFSFGHCVVCSSIYDSDYPFGIFELLVQILLMKKTTTKYKIKTQRQNNTKIK